MTKLLTRNQFRELVFLRDNYRCVICGADGMDAHHIMERRLFADGGYYLDNGATLCSEHHLKTESTELSCEEIRELAHIDTVVLPEHLYVDERWDKWGNMILPNGSRMRGELFYDESVQKILKPVLGQFTKYVKYPRTYHLPWSNATKDDKVLQNTDCFKGKEVVVTYKMDGENTTMYNDHIHARSIDGRNHPSRNWVKNLHSKIAWEIPNNWRICGENLYAKHSIGYSNLPSFSMVFSIWDGPTCLDWSTTGEYASLLGLTTVPVRYRGVFDELLVRTLCESLDTDKHEGYVIRLASQFNLAGFRNSIAKYVRPNHVQTHGHWMRDKIEVNQCVS